MEESSKEKRILQPWLIIFCGVMLVLPFLAGGIVSGMMNDAIYLEVILVIFGILTLMFAMIRIFFRDRVNYRTNKTVFENHQSREYKVFIYDQWILVAVGAALLLSSLIVFIVRI